MFYPINQWNFQSTEQSNENCFVPREEEGDTSQFLNTAARGKSARQREY